MIPIEPPPDYGELLEIAKSQPEYKTLIARYDKSTGAISTMWEFTEQEKNAIAQGAPLHLEIYTFGHAMNPVLMFVDGLEPLDKNGEL